MASAGAGGSLPPNFLLTPQQQSLLFAALNSNKQPSVSPSSTLQAPTTDSMIASSMRNNAGDNTRAGVGSGPQGFQESPLFDNYDYDFGDSSFDFSFTDGNQPQLIGDMPDTSKTERSESPDNDKRSHPEDAEDEDSPEQDPKRHESSEKVPKKPGRKPLTSEPSSKRKAQNRAAQRAFRERKEKHLKDLETKVEELEKASEDANHENRALRAQIERMSSELMQYKQQVNGMSSRSSPKNNSFGSAAVNKLSDVNFQFEFPKFGMGVLPGPPANNQQRSTSQPTSPPTRVNGATPARSQSNDSKTNQLGSQPNQNSYKDDFAKFSGIFTPSMTSSNGSASRVSVDSGSYSVGPGTTSSPSASSNSNVGPSSSCGTSPEPFTQSPMGFKPIDTLTTIGEEQPSVSNVDQPFAQFANVDFSSSNFDWLAQQNGGQFDPQLYGDYREPQENILANNGFDDFFNDAIDADFFTPFNIAPSPNLQKTNLIDQIDAQQNSIDDEPKKTMSCTQLWDKLQSCPKAQSGDIDLDGLCSELTKKAKCSGSGPVVGETDFDSILNKYMGKEVSRDCVASKLGIAVNKDKSLGVAMP